MSARREAKNWQGTAEFEAAQADDQLKRAVAAEARVEGLEAALKHIADGDWNGGLDWPESKSMREYANAALRGKRP